MKSLNMIREALRNRRNELGMTQQEVAERLGGQYGSSVTTLEQGRIDLRGGITLPKLVQWANALGMDVEIHLIRADGKRQSYPLQADD